MTRQLTPVAGENYVTALVGAFTQPIADLHAAMSHRGPQGANAVQASTSENGSAVSIIALAVLMIESACNRTRLCVHRQFQRAHRSAGLPIHRLDCNTLERITTGAPLFPVPMRFTRAVQNPSSVFDRRVVILAPNPRAGLAARAPGRGPYRGAGPRVARRAETERRLSAGRRRYEVQSRWHPHNDSL